MSGLRLLVMSSFANIEDLKEETIAIILISETVICVHVCVYSWHACHVCPYVPMFICS